jgi:hypothetical protein
VQFVVEERLLRLQVSTEVLDRCRVCQRHLHLKWFVRVSLIDTLLPLHGTTVLQVWGQSALKHGILEALTLRGVSEARHVATFLG